MSTPDRERLARWLLDAGGSAALAEAVRAPEWSAATWSPLPYDDRRLLLEGLLQLVCDPRADEAALDEVERVGRDAGFPSDQVEGLVGEVLGITMVRLRAHAVLGLPLHATADEIKRTHRTVAKALHPDRLRGVDDEARKAAEHLLGRINHARAALLSAEEIVTSGPDDVPLEPEGRPVEEADPEPRSAEEIPLEPVGRSPDDVLLGEPVSEDVPLEPTTDLDLTDLLELG